MTALSEMVSVLAAVGVPAYEPSSWFGLAGYGLVAIAAVIVAGLGAWSTMRGNRSVRSEVASVKDDVSKVRDQVENDHATNMRDDIDRAIRLIEANVQVTELVSRQLGEVKNHVLAHGKDIGGLRTEIGELRGGLRQERRDRKEDREALERRIEEALRHQ